MMRSIFRVLPVALLLAPEFVHAAGAPFLIGSASSATGASQLAIHLTKACPKEEMVQVAAVSAGGKREKITASDSGHVNIYQAGSGAWKSRHSITGSFLATTSPREPTNAGLAPPAIITVTYSSKAAWKAAIAVCVPGLETNSGSADNKAGISPTDGDGPQIDLRPSSRLLSLDEPLFVATVLLGDANDRWKESAGYTTLMTLQNHNTLTLAYQIISGANPTSYLAGNSAARPWSAANRSYKTPFKRKDANGE